MFLKPWSNSSGSSLDLKLPKGSCLSLVLWLSRRILVINCAIKSVAALSSPLNSAPGLTGEEELTITQGDVCDHWQERCIMVEDRTVNWIQEGFASERETLCKLVMWNGAAFRGTISDVTGANTATMEASVMFDSLPTLLCCNCCNLLGKFLTSATFLLNYGKIFAQWIFILKNHIIPYIPDIVWLEQLSQWIKTQLYC